MRDELFYYEPGKSKLQDSFWALEKIIELEIHGKHRIYIQPFSFYRGHTTRKSLKGENRQGLLVHSLMEQQQKIEFIIGEEWKP